MTDNEGTATLSPEAPAAAPVAPVVPVAPAAPVVEATPTPAVTGSPEPMSKREAMQAARDKAGQRAAEIRDRALGKTTQPVEAAIERIPTPATVDATGRAHDPATGEFVPKPGDAVQTPQAIAPVVEAPKVASTPTIRVDIPQDHHIRSMNREAFQSLTDPYEAQMVQTLLNETGVRRAQLAAAEAKLAERDAEILQAKRERAALTAGRAAQEKFMQTPQYEAARAEFVDIRDGNAAFMGATGKEAASAYWRAIQWDFKQQHAQEIEASTQVIDQQAMAAEAEKWTYEAWERASAVPEQIRSLPDFPRWFREERAYLEAALDNGLEVQHFDAQNRPLPPRESLHAEYAKRLGLRLQREPAVVAEIRKAQGQRQQHEQSAKAQAEAQAASAARAAAERAAGEAAAVEKYRQELAAKRTAVPPHALGNLGGASVIGQSVPPAALPEATVGEDMSPQAIKKHFVDQARQRARAFSPQR